MEPVKSPSRYVQVLATSEGVLFAECVSNEFLQDDDQLGNRENELLPILGWDWPAPPNKPNWTFQDELLNTGNAVSDLLIKTIRRVFSCTDDDILLLKVFPSLELSNGRQVNLRQERDGSDSRSLWAHLDDDGNLHIDGQDLGPRTALVSDDDEYEWFETIRAEDVPKVVALLGGSTGDDVLDLLEAHYTGKASYELEKRLLESDVKVEFYSC